MISFVITAKNEPYLDQTVASLYENADHPIQVLAEEDDGRGQRAMIHKLVKQAHYPVICKVDAHCTFGPHFDKYLLEDLDERTVIAPILYPLDGETWTINHHNPMKQFAFDTKLIMHHVKGEAGETMCMQGSFFMCYKDFFYEAQLCDESLGSWGSQSVELGIQAWSNGGRCFISGKTFYAHVFKHKDDEFPYLRNHEEIDKTYKNVVLKYKDKPEVASLVKRFHYPLDWNEKN